MIIFATACKKDDPIPGPTKEDLIVGDWTLESQFIDDGLILIGFGGEFDTTTFTYQSKNEDFELELNENKSFTASGSLTRTVSTINSDGEETIEDEVVSDTTATGSWVIDGDILKITANGEVTENKIIELTTSKLKYETKEVENTTVEVFGIILDVNTSSTSVSIYKK